MYDIQTENASERGLIVGLVLPDVSLREAQDTLDELTLLADTAGVEVVEQVLQERQQIEPAYFIGRGKAEEIAEWVKEHNVQAVIFDDDLSPAQTRNLETMIEVKIIDRSRLILDIFASRAKTREAQTQVELAQLVYMLPRLTRQWTHLSRQAGGTGGGGVGTRGPGETQLEVDRRATRYRITILKQALARISKQRAIARKQRGDIFQAALVGYTNAGKSTLMRALSGADVFIENRLFATLDSTTRRISLGYNREILLSDTVGFIKKLPHHLIASFRSTLEEAIEANLLLHVVDASHSACEEHMTTVTEVLSELEVADNPTMLVFNKSDLIERETRAYLTHQYPEAVWVSAHTGEGLDDLRWAIYNHLEGDRIILNVQIPQHEGKLLSELYRVGEILHTDYQDNDVLLEIKLSQQNAQRLLPNERYYQTAVS
ncbi:MAG: GTPase HflX [Candidatus Latescibacteria bacterium]|jgi:GTP-binding protein HflX|nr:GTPase HflX [Candidatus Latescibacterota bacterium]